MDIALIPTVIEGEPFTRLPVDIGIAKGDLIGGMDLNNAILLSLFTDARALDSDVTPTRYRGGFWGNQYLDPNSPTGSRLWLLARKGVTRETVNTAKTMCIQALQWLVNINAVKQFSVEVSIRENGDGINIDVLAVMPNFTQQNFQYSYLWQQLRD